MWLTGATVWVRRVRSLTLELRSTISTSVTSFICVCLSPDFLSSCLQQTVAPISGRYYFQGKITCLGSYTLSCDILNVQGDHHWGAWDSLTESDIKWQSTMSKFSSNSGTAAEASDVGAMQSIRHSPIIYQTLCFPTTHSLLPRFLSLSIYQALQTKGKPADPEEHLPCGDSNLKKLPATKEFHF